MATTVKMTAAQITSAATQLKAEAQGQCSRWPQYKDHFTDYILVRAKKRITTKMGVAVEKGELTIATAQSCPPDEWSRKPKSTRTIWSFRSGIDTSVYADDLDIVAPN